LKSFLGTFVLRIKGANLWGTTYSVDADA